MPRVGGFLLDAQRLRNWATRIDGKVEDDPALENILELVLVVVEYLNYNNLIVNIVPDGPPPDDSIAALVVTIVGDGSIDQKAFEMDFGSDPARLPPFKSQGKNAHIIKAKLRKLFGDEVDQLPFTTSFTIEPQILFTDPRSRK